MAADLPSEGRTPSPMPGYRIVQRIGTGGMGTVYLAIDKRKNRKVALKMFSKHQSREQPELLERFNAESRCGRRLNHENVASFYRFGRKGKFNYLAMEFVDGVNLEDYVTQRNRLSNLQALDFIMQATRAVQHLHRHGIVHRDIKPSNFLITRQSGRDRIKLIDLGLTQTALPIDYVSPEQVRDKTGPNIRSNIYSLGCMWYHLLAGHAPFHVGTANERLTKHIEEDPRPIGEINPDVTVGCSRILSRMLAKDPLQRYSGSSRLLRDLEKEFAVWQLADPAVSDVPAISGSAGLGREPVRLRKGRRQFIRLEDEKHRASSVLFGRRKKGKRPFPIRMIIACCLCLRRLLG